MVCPPVRGDNPRALASGLSPVQVDKPWYNYFIPPFLMHTLLSMTHLMLKFANSSKAGIKLVYTAIQVSCKTHVCGISIIVDACCMTHSTSLKEIISQTD